jgi:hypothetical protein
MSRKPTAKPAAPTQAVTVLPFSHGAYHAFRVFDRRTRRAAYFDTEAQAIAHALAIA